MPPKKRKKAPAKSTYQPVKKTKQIASTSSNESTTQVRTQTVSFLNLPTELRQKIYEAFFQLKLPRHHCDKGCTEDCSRSCDATAFLYLSRQIYSEVWPLFTDYHTFSIPAPLSSVDEVLQSLRAEHRLPIKHLTLVGSRWGAQLQDIERLWWTYLDVLPRLETITFETTTKKHQGPAQPIALFTFFDYLFILPLLIGLLNQGGTTNPTQKWDALAETITLPPQDTWPASYQWELSLEQKQAYQYREKWSKKWQIKSTTRCVLRQNTNPIYVERTKQFCKWRKEKGMITTPGLNWINGGPFLPDYHDLQSIIPSESPPYEGLSGDNITSFFYDANTLLNVLVDTAVMTKGEHGDGCVIDGIGIIGRWVNHAEQQVSREEPPA